MSAVLELNEVTKQFGPKTAVDGLTLRLEEGTFLGLLGRNGAGKSNTIKMITGLLRPTKGDIRVFGRTMAQDPLYIKRNIGVMPEDLDLLDRLTGPQYLRFVGRMYGLEDRIIDARRDEMFDKLDLKPGPRTLLCDYSYGMKKKIALCATLIHGPKFVLLDEPFEGIDPLTSRTIKDILKGLQRKGVTIILTSHIMEIVEKLCPLIVVLDEGRLKGMGTLEELQTLYGKGRSLETLVIQLMGGSKTGDLSWL